MKGKFRHEMKYVIPRYLYQEMTQVFREIMEYDSHAGPSHSYNIRSLYFDDMYRTAYKEKLDGIQYRKKYRILLGDFSFLLKREEQMAKEFFVDARTRLMKPEVIVEYDREPFVYKTGTVRITFDKDLRAISWKDNMFDPLAPSFSVMNGQEMILEIKFTGLLPEKIRRLFRTYEIVQTSASKFCMCVDKIGETLQH